MRWLIINTEAFSVKGMKAEKEITKAILPRVLLLFLKVFPYPYIILDESSKIKTNTPMPEHKKSSRCRAIKLLNDVGERTIMTGTLKSKTPLNVYDQVGFLDPRIFPETMYEFAERYCIMITIRVGRGRRVIISQKIYDRIRTRLVNAYKRGGEEALSFSKSSVFKEMVISEENLEWIMQHKVYTPFIHQDELFRRIKPYAMVVRREDIFDIKFEYFIHNPIMRYVEPTKKQRALTNELVTLGFTDNLTLGRAPALELMHRLQDVCNGFEPVEHRETVVDKAGQPKEVRTIQYKPLADNPKLEEIFELIDEIDSDENQIAIFYTRTNLADAIIERLNSEEISFAHYAGTDKEKQAAEEMFASGSARIFLSNMRSAAYGLNCLAQCDYGMFACVDNETEAYYQCRHRFPRGQLTHAKFLYNVALRGSIEERTIRSLNIGIDLINGTNDKSTFELKE